jgi:hypothetical protein
MLGLYLSDALSRIHGDSTTVIYKPVPDSEGFPTLVNLHDIHDGARIQHNWFKTWSKEAVASNWTGWTEIQYTAQRRGYGWRIKDVTMQLAVVILLLQAAIGLLHVTVLLTTRKTFQSCNNIMEMVVLALKSPSVGPDSIPDGLEGWTRTLKVEDHGDHDEFVVLP